MIISSNMTNIKGQNYSNNLNSTRSIRNNASYTYCATNTIKNGKQVSFGVMGWDDLLVVTIGMVASRIIGKVIDHVGSAIVKHFRPSVAPGPLTRSAIEHSEQASRDVVEKIGTTVRKHAEEHIRIAKKKGTKVNPQTIREEHLKIQAEKWDEVLIPLKGEGYEQGLNKVIGFAKLKTGLYEDVLMPLCEIMKGKKSQHMFVPNGINFFGPMGTGKTHFATQLGEHYVKKGGRFVNLRPKLTSDVVKDIATLKAEFAEAKKIFEESGRKKYTMLFIDEIEKVFDINDPNQRPVMAHLLGLANDCKDNGVILMTTSNYLDKVEPALLRNGRTDILINCF